MRLRPFRLAALLGLLLAVFVSIGSSSAFATPFGPGTAIITSADQATLLDMGGSGTHFSMKLPKGARCGGDSMHDGYRVYSYLIPHGTPVSDDGFESWFPSKWYGMFTDLRYYGDVNTAPTTGVVEDIPNDLVWSRFTAQMLIPTGAEYSDWDVGLACIDSQYRVQTYWSTTLRFDRSHSDPAGFTFQVVGQKPAGSHGAHWPYYAGLAVIVAALGLLIFYYKRQRDQLERVDA